MTQESSSQKPERETQCKPEAENKPISQKGACTEYASKFSQATLMIVIVSSGMIMFRPKHPPYLVWGAIIFSALSLMWLVGYAFGCLQWRFSQKR
jgi:hypothetical protein